MTPLRRGAPPPYQLLSVLLRYPDQRLLDGRAELAVAVHDLTDPRVRKPLARFVDHLQAGTAADLATHYVDTFDLDRRCCLHLSYYEHGDTRKRGAALLALRQRYTAAGLQETTAELPDHLPVMLEFAAAMPADGLAVLQEHRPAIELLRTGLHGAASPYRHVLDGLCDALPRPTPLQRARLQRLAAQEPPSEEVGLAPFAPAEGRPEMRP